MTNIKCDVCFNVSTEIAKDIYRIGKEEDNLCMVAALEVCLDCFENKSIEEIVTNGLKSWWERNNDKQ